MGDCLQSLVARQLPAERAEAAAARVRASLVSRRIVVPETSDSVLGGSGAGHRPGESYFAATSIPDEHLGSLAVNGVDIEVGRIVAVDPQGESRWQCARCERWHASEDGLMDALSSWYEGDDEAAVSCPACGASTRLSVVAADPPVACGHLGITFWNWPPLAPAFVQDLATIVGEPLTWVAGKL